MRNNGSRRGGSKKERDYIEYEGGRMTRNGLSANHLLNFTLPEREKQQAQHHGKKKKSAPTRTQMEYLHANYRFVIAPLTDDTAVSCWDIETLTEWKSVEQVLLCYDESSPATCPICLDNFRAPKITRCGHIFCWPCILRYLSMTDKYWRRCPMCFDSVQKGQLRSVRLESVQLPPQLDSQATFQFLQRPKASLSPHTRDSTGSPTAPRKRVRKLPTVYDEDAKYARILESTREYVVQLALSEMRDLEALDAECRSSGDTDTLPFVEEAMKATSGRLAGYETAASESAQSANGYQSLDGLAPSDLYSFYQLQNGCYVILHPLNVKCLTKEFAEKKERKPSVDSEDHVTEAWTAAASPPASGRFDGQPSSTVNYDMLPNTIQGRVLDVEHLVMDDDVQKRYRFLGHLPKFCDFYVCELDLSEMLSPETLHAFKGEFKKREKMRRAKREAEKKAKKSGLSGAEATPRSPVFRQMPAFSLDAAAAHWPAPAELSLSDSFDGGMQVIDTSGDEELAAVLAASSMMSPPFGASSSTYAVDDGVYGSFATITRNSGYFPPLGGSTPNDTGSAPTTGSPMWGATSPPLLGAPGPGVTGGSKKKGAMKKGTQLFSTAQRRSYR